MNILGIGEVVLDKTYLLDGFPQENSKTYSKQVQLSIGGPVSSALILLSHLGIKTTFITAVGNDQNGIIIKKELQKEKINLINQEQSHTKTHTVLVNSKNGRRTIIKDTHNSTPIRDISAELIKTADLIFFDRHEIQALDEVIRKKRDETKIIIDPSTEISPKIIKMLRKTDYPIIPIESLTKLSCSKSLEINLAKLFQKIRKTIIVTAGKYGSLIFDQHKITVIPSFEIDVVDELGAGDVYRGAFGFGIIHGWNLINKVQFANLVAALQCMRIGNGSAIPTRQEISQFKHKASIRKVTLQQIKKYFLSLYRKE